MEKKKLIKNTGTQPVDSENKRAAVRANALKLEREQIDKSRDNYINPYNFVPLSDRVYQLTEDECQQLKYVHDIPFSDGLSGKLTVNFEAMSPICVRSGDDGVSNAAFNGKYYIPGSSIKGMIKNVFDIITYANIKNSSANDRYSMRDMYSPAYQLKGADKPQKGGILIQYQGDYYVVASKATRYTYNEIKDDAGVFLKSVRGIKAKYSALKDYVEYRNNKHHIWLFSGDMFNKKGEYLLEIPDNLSEKNLIKLKDNELKDFLFIHQIENENESWSFWKQKLKNYNSLEDIAKEKYKGIAPCFFRTKKDESGSNVVKDLGFAFLYRQPYDKTIHDCLPNKHKEDKKDLSQAIFGYSLGDNSLKGRVRFANSFIQYAKELSPQFHVLNSPKPTFYPFYLKQNSKSNQNTYFAKDSMISGWKRYLIQNNAQLRPQIGDKAKIESEFIPLEEGTSFETDIWFHNLRPYELGALISAINFCERSECFHSLGFAKPYGYGKLKVNSVDYHSHTKGEQIDLSASVGIFEKHLFDRCGVESRDKWMDSLSMLFLFASGRGVDKLVRYPDMQNGEFKDMKSKRTMKSLKDYSPKGYSL